MSPTTSGNPSPKKRPILKHLLLWVSYHRIGLLTLPQENTLPPTTLSFWECVQKGVIQTFHSYLCTHCVGTCTAHGEVIAPPLDWTSAVTVPMLCNGSEYDSEWYVSTAPLTLS